MSESSEIREQRRKKFLDKMNAKYKTKENQTHPQSYSPSSQYAHSSPKQNEYPKPKIDYQKEYNKLNNYHNYIVQVGYLRSILVIAFSLIQCCFSELIPLKVFIITLVIIEVTSGIISFKLNYTKKNMFQFDNSNEIDFGHNFLGNILKQINILPPEIGEIDYIVFAMKLFWEVFSDFFLVTTINIIYLIKCEYMK